MIVLDASALVDVVIDQPAKGWVLDHIAGEPLIAPAHQPAEVLSALARLVRADVLTHAAADEALREARQLHQDLVEPTADQLTAALALQERVRVLDGLYVVLAQDHDATLLTTDLRLANAEPGVPLLAPART